MKTFFFLGSFLPDNNAHFTLDKRTRELTLLNALNRKSQRIHKIQIKATNDIDGFNFSPALFNNTMEITVEVIISNPPVFIEKEYTGGISISDPKGKTILYVLAESHFQTFYYILEDSITSHGENIEDFKYQMFDLVKETGKLYLTSSVKTNMKGYFKFVVIAHNLTDYLHNDTVPVTVHIVGENNRVKFEFLNNASQVDDNEIYVSIFRICLYKKINWKLKIVLCPSVCKLIITYM